MGFRIGEVFSSFSDFVSNEENFDIDLIITEFILDNGQTAKDFFTKSKLPLEITIIVYTHFYNDVVYDTLQKERPLMILNKSGDQLNLKQAIGFLKSVDIK